MATFVLVPGAWCGGWVWKDVARTLRAAGHDALPLTLTGLGERVHLAHPDVGIETHVQDVVNVLDYEDLTEVFLVGWSYGGAVVTVVAHRVPQRIKRLVILDTSVIPEDGQSIYDVAPEYKAEDDPLLEAGDGWRIPPPPGESFAQSFADPERRRWIVERLTPLPVRTASQPVRLGHSDAAGLPKTLIRCTQAPSWSQQSGQRFIARIQQDPRWEIVDLDGRHTALMAIPQATADVLSDIVARHD
jgi:pimeloyl-ACP methyl ester carboxylesterase